MTVVNKKLESIKTEEKKVNFSQEKTVIEKKKLDSIKKEEKPLLIENKTAQIVQKDQKILNEKKKPESAKTVLKIEKKTLKMEKSKSEERDLRRTTSNLKLMRSES